MPLLSRWSRLVVVLVVACSSDSPGGGGDGSVEAGPLASQLGVASYEATDDGEALVLALLDGDGGQLGTVSVTSEDGDVLVLELDRAGSPAASGTLRTVFSAPEPEGPALLVMELDVAGKLFRARVVGGYDPFAAGAPAGDGWARSATLETPLAAGEPPPGVGGVRRSDGSLLSVFTSVDADGHSAAEEELATWLVQTELVELAETDVDELLLAVLFDVAFVLEHLDGASAADDDGIDRQPLGSCDDRAFDATLREACSRMVARSCILSDDYCAEFALNAAGERECVKARRIGSFFEVFTAEGCLWNNVACLGAAARAKWCASPLTEPELEALTAYCSERSRRCVSPQQSVPRWDGAGCECACTDEGCASHCGELEELLGLTAAPSCDDVLSCDCGFDAASVCAAELPDEHCGGGTFDALDGGFYCPSARCGDGAFSPTCDGDPSRAEECDDSAPDGLACPAGMECAGCACLPCEVAVTCGDGRVSRACPGLEEECDGEGQAQCADGYECELCGCVTPGTTEPDAGVDAGADADLPLPDVRCEESVTGYLCADGGCPAHSGASDCWEAESCWCGTERSDAEPVGVDGFFYDLECDYTPDGSCRVHLVAQWAVPGYGGSHSSAATRACDNPGQFVELASMCSLNSGTHRAAVTYHCYEDDPEWAAEVLPWATRLLESIEPYADPCP